MNSRRQILLDWMEQGRIAPENLQRALSVTGVLPSGASWRRFLDHLFLWTGTLMLAAGVICFFAFNWNDLDRFAKFGLVETLIVGALIVVWRLGLEHIAGKVTLLVASLFVGVLLALIGQTYQTGADTFELFAAWAAFILPWVLAGRLAALWLVWLTLLNLATILYYKTFDGLFGLLFSPTQSIWILFALNTIALVIWEFIAARGTRDQWAIRILATASGGLITTLAVYFLVEMRSSSGWALLAWFAWLAIAYLVYRHILRDVYVLAGGVLSIIIVVATGLAQDMLKSGDSAGTLLFIGLVVIGLSAAGGWWLKRVAGEARS